MQRKKTIKKIKQLEDDCIALRKKNLKSESLINKLKKEQNKKSDAHKHNLLQCLQRKKELVC